MRIRISILLLVAIVAIVAGCSDDSSSPQNDGPASFGKMMGSHTHETVVTGAAVLSDGTRVACGDFDGFLHVTGSPDSIAAGGAARNFLAEFKPDGSLLKAVQIAGGAVGMRRMARDRDDNLVLVGTFAGTSTFGNVSIPAVNGDMIFAKVDRNGNVIFVHSGSGTGLDQGMDVATASDGSIYLTGIASSEMTVGGEDVGQTGHATGFLVKLGSNGVGVWQQTAGTTGGTTCDGVAVSEDGTVIACGEYNGGNVDFSGDVLTNDGGADSFIGRFEADGTPLGSIHIGGTDDQVARDVTTLDSDVIVTGTFSGIADFDVDSAGGNITASGDGNAFVARYTKSGSLRWVKTFGPGDKQTGRGVARLSGGRILVCGEFLTTITLGSKTFTSNGTTDVFIARLDGNGNVLSASQLGGAGSDETTTAVTTGRTAIVVGSTESGQVIFPDGSRHNEFGPVDGYLFQEP
ncbi:MAG TPA: hypothetical protein VJS69_02605 [Candidatus Krumholzibacteria bacterium]|nr:hypothetical protein [Candidatus Krumholzibacteria bacterium]